MTNDVGSTLVNSLTNSSFDIGNMSKVLAEADVAGPRSIVERGLTKSTTELDALKYMQTNLEAFNTYVTDLSSPDLFKEKTATSSSDSIVTATADETAANGTYEIESMQLAQSHTLIANKTFASPYETLTNGTLTIEVAGQTHDITIDASNNTLEALQKQINNGDYGVNASVVNNGGVYQMMFSSQTSGATGEISVSGITEFDTDGFTTTSEAQDAVMKINGLEVTNSSNTFDDVIDGMSFQLNAASVGTKNYIEVSQDSSTVVEKVKEFVDIYNQLETILDELAEYDTSDLTEEQLESDEYKYYGDLAGNSVLRQVRSEIKNSLTGSIEELTGDYNSLIVVGIEFDIKGNMSLDEDVFKSIAENNLSELAGLFAKGGSSEDNLINVLSGNEHTQTGQYNLNITQLAERATVDSGAATFSTDEQVSGDKITDQTSAITIAASANLDITIDGVNQAIDLSSIAGTYDSKDDVASAIQTSLDTAFGGNLAAVSYDVSQSRFEITANSGEGAVTVNSTTNLTNQGFEDATAYSGEALMNLNTGDLTFDLTIDDADATSVTIAQGRYTQEEFATTMTTAINNLSELQENGTSVIVTESGTGFNVSSTRFGAYSKVDLSNFSATMNVSGFTADVSDDGQSVDGTITTDQGTLNIGAYADASDGRIITISDFAVIGDDAADVRGLSFEVLGGATGDRGDINFAQGFASRIEEKINEYFEDDSGLAFRRMENLSEKIDDYNERNKKLDTRYEQLELKYKLQFSTLQSIMSQAEQTRNQLSAQFSNKN